MAEYYPLLAKAVAGLPNSTPETRRAVHESARKALLGQLRSLQPPVPEADVARETQSLDMAMERIEAELSGPNGSVAEAPATPAQPTASPPIKAASRPADSMPAAPPRIGVPPQR